MFIGLDKLAEPKTRIFIRLSFQGLFPMNIAKKNLPVKIPLIKSLIIESPKQIVDLINADENIFTASKVTIPVVLLKGVGRFCICGCGRPIRGKWVKSLSTKGKKYMRFVKPRHDQVYASIACGNRMRGIGRKNHQAKGTMRAIIKLKTIPDTIPYKEMIIYYGDHQKKTVKIIPAYKDLWEQLERYCKYTHIPKQEFEIVTS